MDRRTVLRMLGGTLIGATSGAGAAPADPQEEAKMPARSNAQNYYTEEITRRKNLAASFPYERIQTTAIKAFDLMEKLKNKGRGYPILTGTDEDDLWQIVEQIQSDIRTPEQILSIADSIDFPADLNKYFKKIDEDMEELLNGGNSTEPRDKYSESAPEPPLGEWPDIDPNYLKIPPGLGTALASHFQPEDPAQILLIPTDDSTAIPAYLKWGGWNRCPAPEYQIAGLRSWRSRYNAELVSLRTDILVARVQRLPATREEALSLAHEQYLYDEDLVLQNTQNFATLAAIRMSFDWWTFWWD